MSCGCQWPLMLTRPKNHIYGGQPESKERLHIHSAHLFCCSRSIIRFQCDVVKLPHAVVRHVVCAEIAVAMAVPIENPADCEVRGFIRFMQASEILGYLAEEASSRVELFCCTTMHVRTLLGRHKPCIVSNSIETSSSILRTVRTWHHQNFFRFQKWRSTLLVNASQTMNTWRMLSAATWYEEGIHKLVPRYKCHNAKGDYDEDLKDAVVTWLNNQATTWYEEGIHQLVPRYNVKGDYVER